MEKYVQDRVTAERTTVGYSASWWNLLASHIVEKTSPEFRAMMFLQKCYCSASD